MLNYIKQGQEFKLFADGINTQKQKVLSLVMATVCILLLIDNEIPVFPLHFEEELTYYNISLVFSFAFFAVWLLIILSSNYFILRQVSTWSSIFTGFLFMHFISYLEILNGHGLTALALGTITMSVVVSSNYLTLISFIVVNNFILYLRIEQLPEVVMSSYKMSIFALTALSIVVFIIIENQRREMFLTQQKLAKKVDELNKALDVKSVFFGHMSHELRTPLNAIIGFSEMILSGAYRPRSEEKIKEYVGLIHAGGTHLLSIVNDILDSSKLEAGQVEATLEQLELKDTLENYLSELGAITLDKKQSVRLVMESENIIINTDRRLLKQIIFNLVSNAQKFSSIGGLIEILVKNNGSNWIDIIVKDYGKGMEAEQLEIIKAENNPSNSHFVAGAEGTGLGIIIVKQIVKLLNGKINFFSTPGVGTEIKISFPI